MAPSSIRRTVPRGARAAVTAGLGIALALGQAAVPPGEARAETGSVTIAQRHNAGATYDAYQVFSADITQQDVATDIGWSSDAVRQAVLAYLDGAGYEGWLAERHPGDGQHDRAQVAAEYVAEMIEGSPTAEGASGEGHAPGADVTAAIPRTTSALSFANGLARRLALSGAEHQVVREGTPAELDEGLWLFVTTDATSEANGEAGTAPIWLPVGGSVSSLHEKTDAPTLDKAVREDSTSVWSRTADANRAQQVDYVLTGTLPENFGAFDTYHYAFTDTLSEGLTIDVPSGKGAGDVVAVRIDGAQVPADGRDLRVTYEGNVLKVDFADLKSQALSGYKVDKDSVITVEYACHLNDRCKVGAKGNPNEVYLTYTDDPITNHDGRTDNVTNKLFTYQLCVTKTGKGTGKTLEGAKFTVRVSEKSSDAGSRGKYVKPDGSLASEPYEYTTDKSGQFSVVGIDEGTYLIAETAAPNGYDRMPGDVEVAIGSDLRDEDLSLASLTARTSSGMASVGGVAAEDGLARVTISNEATTTTGKGTTTGTTTRERLAQTGVGPIGVALVATGTAVVSVALARRRRARSEEQS